jgi:uncharacterized cupredoxin-like copper-binding protein
MRGAARPPLICAVLVMLVGAACGGGGSAASSVSAAASSIVSNATDTSGGTAGQAIEIDVVPGTDLKFVKTELTASAGTVTLNSKNPQAIPHAIALEGNGVDEKGDTVVSGGVSTITANLKPGTYTFYCPVPGHREAGMEGTLTVS